MITGKEALIALANGEEVEYFDDEFGRWISMDMGHYFEQEFRLKPRTITLNGIEVPAPFKPKDGDAFYFPCPRVGKGYVLVEKINSNCVEDQFGAWRTEDEIKQVVAALREVFRCM